MKSLLLPFSLAALLAGAHAAPCTPDATNTTVTVTSKKFYCSEGFDSQGCNLGRVRLKVDVASTCRSSAAVDLLCSADLEIMTRSVDTLPQRLEEPKRIRLENGRAEETLFLAWREFGYPALKVDVIAAECRIGDALPPQEEDEPADTETEKAAEVQPAITDAPEPAQKPETVPEKTPAEESAAKPETAASPATSDKEAYELELLKEQNRARELEIKALELKIKLKEMEAKE